MKEDGNIVTLNPKQLRDLHEAAERNSLGTQASISKHKALNRTQIPKLSFTEPSPTQLYRLLIQSVIQSRPYLAIAFAEECYHRSRALVHFGTMSPK